MIVSFLATFCEEIPLNGAGSIHYLSHDKNYYIHERVENSKKHEAYSSGGLVNSMMESCEDTMANAKSYTRPTLVFLAGKDKVVNNDGSKKFLAKCGVPKAD